MDDILIMILSGFSFLCFLGTGIMFYLMMSRFDEIYDFMNKQEFEVNDIRKDLSKAAKIMSGLLDDVARVTNKGNIVRNPFPGSSKEDPGERAEGSGEGACCCKQRTGDNRKDNGPHHYQYRY